MNKKQKCIQTYGLWILDIACIVITYQIATFIRYFGRTEQWGNKNLHYMVLVIFILFSTLYSFVRDWNYRFTKRGYLDEFIAVAQYIVSMFLVSITFVFFFRWAYILSRTVIFNFAWMCFVLTYLVHTLYKHYLYRIYNNASFASQVVVVAQKDLMENTLNKLIFWQ